jgi:hypothetical protein
MGTGGRLTDRATKRPWLGKPGPLVSTVSGRFSACRDDLCGPYGLCDPCDPTTSRDMLRDAGDRAPSRNASRARLQV